MRDILRLMATVIIWGAFVPVVGVVLGSTTGAVTRMNGGEIIGMMAIFTAGAVAMTYAVWHSGFNIGTDRSYAMHAEQQRLGKSKRAERPGRDRIERLIDDLDDNEIYRLEELLLGRDQRDQETRQRER